MKYLVMAAIIGAAILAANFTAAALNVMKGAHAQKARMIDKASE